MAQIFRETHFVWIPFGWDPDYVRRVGAEVVLVQGAERFARHGVPSARCEVDRLAAETAEPQGPLDFRRMQDDAARRAEEAIAKQAKWHHRIEVAPGVTTPGLQDTPALLAQIGMPEDLSGMRVLDIGARDGFFTFEAERRGAAEVVALDNEPPHHTGFAIAAELLGSKATYVTENVYSLDEERFGRFDLVLFLGVIYHLRHPLLALDRIHDVTADDGMMLIETHMIDEGLVDSAGDWRKLERIQSRADQAAAGPVLPRRHARERPDLAVGAEPGRPGGLAARRGLRAAEHLAGRLPRRRRLPPPAARRHRRARRRRGGQLGHDHLDRRKVDLHRSLAQRRAEPTAP